MKVQIVRLLLVLEFSYLLFLHAASSENKCVICKKNCEKNKENTRSVESCENFFEQCFGVKHAGPGVICSSCRRAVSEYKASGKTFFHVSIKIKTM